LNEGTDTKDDTNEDETPLSAQKITDWISSKGTEERASLIYGNDVG
jgi:hypothetical protein